MTRDEILAMEAGPALDAVIADMLGYKAWKEQRGPSELCVVYPPGHRLAEKPWASTRKEYQEPDRYSPVSCGEAAEIGFFGQGIPKFSIDISDAWKVVERLRSDGNRFRWVTVAQTDDHIEIWSCCAWNKDGNRVYSSAATAPRAICLAALLATLEENK